MENNNRKSNNFYTQAQRLAARILFIVWLSVSCNLKEALAAQPLNSKDSNPQRTIFENLEQALWLIERLNSIAYPSNVHAIAMAIHNVGKNCQCLGQDEEARKYYQQALKIYQELYGTEAHPDKAAVLNDMGLCYANLGQYEEALTYYQQAFNIYDELYGKKAQRNKAAALSDMGLCDEHLGKYTESLEYYQQALQIRRVLDTEQNVTELVLDLKNVGRAYYNLDQYTKALELFKEVFAMCEVLHGENEHPDKAAALSAMGLCCENLRKYESALYYCQEALRMERVLRSHVRIAAALFDVGFVYARLGDTNPDYYRQALKHYQQALKMYQELPEVDSGKIAQIDDAIKTVHERLIQHMVNKFESALAAADLDNIQIRAMSIHTMHVYLLAWLVVTNRAIESPMKEQLSQKATDVFEQATKQANDGVKADLYTTYGNFLLTTGKTDKAYDYLHQAIESGDDASELNYGLQERLTVTPVLQEYISQQKQVLLRGIDHAYYLLIHHYEDFQKAGIAMSQTRGNYLKAYRRALDQRRGQPGKEQEDQTASYLLESLYKAQGDQKAAALLGHKRVENKKMPRRSR